MLKKYEPWTLVSQTSKATIFENMNICTPQTWKFEPEPEHDPEPKHDPEPDPDPDPYPEPDPDIDPDLVKMLQLTNLNH